MQFSIIEAGWYFVLYAFLGWCLEEVFCTLNSGKLVNRGFLNGPVCPIYGFGMVLVLALLLPISENHWLLFLGGMILTSALELLGGFVLEKTCHTRWWDYSDQPFNIGGYVCLKFSLAWGICVVIVIDGIHPMVRALVKHLVGVPGIILLVLLLILFVIDLVVTGMTIKKINHHLGALQTVAEKLHESSQNLGTNIGKVALAADEKADAGKEILDKKLDNAKAALADTMDDASEALQDRKDALSGKVDQAKAVLSEKLADAKTALSEAADDSEERKQQRRAEYMRRTSALQRRIYSRLMDAFPDMSNADIDIEIGRLRDWRAENRAKKN